MRILLTLIRKFFITQNVVHTSALTALSQTFGIRSLEVLQPAADRHRTSNNNLFSFSLKNIEERRQTQSLHLTVLDHHLEQASRLYSVSVIVTAWGETLYATRNTIVLHPVKQNLNRSPDAIHPLVVNTRCRSVFRKQPISGFIRLIDIREHQLDPSLSSLQSSEAESAQIIGFV